MAQSESIYGVHAVSLLLERHPERVQQLWLQQGRDDNRMQKLQSQAGQQGVAVQWLSVAELDKRVGEVSHQGVVAQCQPAPALSEAELPWLLDAAGPNPLLLVLDGVTDPHNLGACLRSAEAAGVAAVIVPKDRATGFTPVVRKVACGAAELVPLVQVTNLARTLKSLQQRGIWLIGTAGEAEQLVYQQDLTGPVALVMGAEGKGMRRLTREHCDHLVKLPMLGAVESLNVSVAAGICLFEAVRQRLG